MFLCVRFTYIVRRLREVFATLYSAIGATLDTGCWLGFTRQGLAPCKRHQAVLGALTPRSEKIGAVGFCDISVASQKSTVLIFLQHLLVKDEEM